MGIMPIEVKLTQFDLYYFKNMAEMALKQSIEFTDDHEANQRAALKHYKWHCEHILNMAQLHLDKIEDKE